jgi:hypothetical protein
MTAPPLTQPPARRHLHGFDGDYEVLRELVDVRPRPTSTSTL